MASDTHAHPEDLLRLFPGAEAERRSLGIACAASSCSREDFLYQEEMALSAKNDCAPPMYLCFAVHPQLPAVTESARVPGQASADFNDRLDLLASLAADGRIAAVGEAGFDLYTADYRKTETIQDLLFTAHLEIARRHNLPLILHVRRAMHKIFSHVKTLATLPAVVFHSWPGSPDEAFSLLRRGVRAFFSFGTPLLLNHKKAIHSCAALPPDCLLLETDAPYQPLRNKKYSSWGDLPAILSAAAAIRKEGGAKQGTNAGELEEIIDSNFFGIFK
jgi:TatD DNase family protein